MEAGEISLFMFCICSFATLLQHPASPVRHFFISGIVRRALMGLAIGATVMALIMSPWGKQSGGHINPAMTFAFYRLGKLRPWDALFYGVAQFSGATSGVALATFLLRGAPGDGTVRYAVTAPGVYGAAVAFAAELAISFILMITVLLVTNHERLARYTPYFVGSLYAVNITFETPLSGMSMNPARTFGPAVYGGYWHTLWIYFIAPTAGMLAAAEIFLRVRRGVAHTAPNFTTPITNAASSITHHKFQRAAFTQIIEDDSHTTYGWLDTPHSTHFAPDQALVSTGLCRVKACQELWSNKGPRTVSEGH